jgi:hypothetical protein
MVDEMDPSGDHMSDLRADRPHMPGYGIQGPQDGEGLLSWDHIAGQLAVARNYWIVTASASGRPHATPVWGLWHAGRFYFASGGNSRKARNLAENPFIVVHLESGDQVVILEGTAALIDNPSLSADLDRAYHAKYGVRLEGNATYLVTVEKAFAWAERNFPGSATRWTSAPE